MPVSGNAYQGQRWTKGCAIDFDDSLAKAGLLKDGAEMWMSFLFHTQKGGGGVQVSLQSADGKEGLGFMQNRTSDIFVIQDGKEKKNLFVKGMLPDTTYLFVAKMIWGKDGAPDQWLPYFVEDDLKLPTNNFRTFKEPINIDQSKLSRLVLQGGTGTPVDEIRVGPSFESVTGQGK